jgi:integrase
MPTTDRPDPKYRHYKPKNLAVVRIDGNDIYLGKHDSPESWEKYYRLLAEWRANGSVTSAAKQPTATDDSGLTVNELILAFLKHAESYYRQADGRPTGEVENIRLALRPLRTLYGTTPASAFGPKALKCVRQHMIEAGLGRRTINQRIARIIRAFRFGVENELLTATIHHALKAVEPLKKGRSAAREPKSIKPVHDEHVTRTLPFLPRQLQALVELQRLTGARSGELVIMRTCDLETSGDVWTFTPMRHKNAYRDQDRRIFLGPRAIEALKPWLRLNTEEFLFQPREAMAEHRRQLREHRKTRVQPSQRDRRAKRPKRLPGDLYDPRSYAHAIRAAVQKAGVPHWHPHQLRHNSATYLRKHYGVETARIICGHSSLDATSIYAEADETKAREVMRQIG